MKNMSKDMQRRLGRRALSMSAAALALLAASGCTSWVSHGLRDDGTASEIVFPAMPADPSREGAFPNLDNLRTVGAGMTKDQLFGLLGHPHFREGMFGVREWDYLFHFRTAAGVRTCQYKVLFDKDYVARGFHWQPAACSAVLDDKTPPAAVAVEAPAERRFTLTADALFAFDRGGPQDIKAEGRAQVRQLADSLKGSSFERVEVVGYTDRLGGTAYNLRLSGQRAQTVRALLVDAGVAPERVTASGRGESEPVVQCAQPQSREALIACLAPNRRVDVRVTGNR